jgi:hypothetical protein
MLNCSPGSDACEAVRCRLSARLAQAYADVPEAEGLAEIDAAVAAERKRR